MQSAPRIPPPGLIFDSSLDESIDQVLAAGLLLGFENKRTIRLASVSVSRNNLKVAAFLDLIRRFYGNEQAIGMHAQGVASTTAPPMLQAALDQTAYRRGVARLNDTADPVASIRNGLSAQYDENAAIILAGPPVNLIGLLALPDGRRLAATKPKRLVIGAAMKNDIAGFRKLLAEWPGEIVFASPDLGDALPFPATAIDTAFAWAPNHPVVDAYRAYRAMPYDAPSQAMAAVLYAVQPGEGYFKLSDPGTITVLDDGRATFTPSPAGKHRQLIFDPAQKQRVIDMYVQTVSVQRAQPQGRPGPGAAKQAAKVLLVGALTGLLASVPFQVAGQEQANFEKSVRPVLTETCATCHNARLASGGVDVAVLNAPDSLTTHRETWDRVLRRVRAGEMPPPGVPKPSAERIAAFTGFVQGTFDRTPADPGRVTAHRLNRNEYTNTIRDLLGVHFRAEKYFPTDDSGEGFDNIGDVLTVSPVLMDRYLAASERIAQWAIPTDLPAKPIEHAYHYREQRLRRIDRSTVEAEHRVDFAGDYTIRFALQGERGKDALPVTLALWMDGKLLKTIQAETKPSGLVYFNPYSEEEMRLHLPEGDHVFRAAFVNDDFVRTLDAKDVYDRSKNKFIDSILFIGPFPSAIEKESRKKVLVCDPKTGRACVERIVSTLARRAYRRTVSRGEVEALLRFVDLAQSDGQTVEQGLQLAIQAILVSPHFLFHIEREGGPQSRPISEFELASRLSYFLWSSMPDDELLNLAEAGRLRASLDAQVDRMLADPRAAAFAENFAGQWLETRNLDVVKPDPDKFPEWSSELRDAMKFETTMFFEHVLRENRSVAEFLNADYTFLNERLARHYGIEGVTGSDFRRVELPAGSPRGGVLSQAGVLTVSSYPTRTSPVIRGKYVLQNILGTPPPPPPPDVPPLDESTIGSTMSMREQLEKHRSDPICASCHSKMDPLGFGLENYNAIGKWREKDGNFPVDSSGMLPTGKTFAGPAEMRGVLTSQLGQFSRTLTEKMLIYALGRGLKPYDTRTVDGINLEMERSGYQFQTLIHQIVNSLPFQSRRGETP